MTETVASDLALFPISTESALAGCRQGADDTQLSGALRAQLDRVLDEIWSFAREEGSSLPLAQLAIRLCGLYPEPSAEQEQRVALGALSLELRGADVHTDGQRVRLTRRESEVLRYLLEHRGRVISRYELLDEIWQGRDGSSPRTVDIHIHRLRTKLGRPFAERIETVHNIGYKLCFTPVLPRTPRAAVAELAADAE
jgi:DNA-binding response OmpR family regulator